MLLRIFIEPGGVRVSNMVCPSISKENDQVSKSNARYAVAEDSVDYLSGSEVHFDDGLSGKGFEIRNPNAQSTCGCGKSFS